MSGEYSIQEPGGGIRVVTYKADKDGFHAVVHTKGKNDHSGATYGAHADQGQVQGHQHLQVANQDENGHYDYSQEGYDHA